MTDAADHRARALEQLFAEHVDAVWRFVRRRTASAADADDVTAEVFATAVRRHGSLPPPGERHLWLYGVARNVLANHRRSMRRRERLGRRLVDAFDPQVVPPPEIEDERVLRALASLAEADRELLILRAWDELAVTDIAVLLGTTPNAVSVRLSRARRRLRAVVAEDQPAPARTARAAAGHEHHDPERREDGPFHG